MFGGDRALNCPVHFHPPQLHEVASVAVPFDLAPSDPVWGAALVASSVGPVFAASSCGPACAAARADFAASSLEVSRMIVTAGSELELSHLCFPEAVFE